MKDNVELLYMINEKRKQKQELDMNIKICMEGKLGKQELGIQSNTSNEQMKELELLNARIEKYENEINMFENVNTEVI